MGGTKRQSETELLETRLTDWLAEHENAMIELLRDLVNIDSHTSDKAGVDRVIARIHDFLKDFDISTRVVENESAGNFLHARIGSTAQNTPPVLLLGHCDTVFPAGEVSRRPFHINDGRAYGPGVADMKGGLVINAFVLAALAKTTSSKLPVCALFTSDEEVASPVSRAEIAETTREARAVFNAEPGRPSGNVTVGRKGGLFMRLDMSGRAAHSGSHFSHGISAIEALAQKIIRLHALTDLDIGVTVNVGVISGGLTLNTVADHASAEFELRYIDAVHRDDFLARVEDIIDAEDVPGCRASLIITGEFLPLVQTGAAKALYRDYDAAAATIGVHFGEEFSGGCSDAGIPCSQGVPTICGTGPVGGGSHTIEEYIELNTLLTRAQTLALTVLRSNKEHSL